ncbi:MAG: hypothetical protein FWC74_09480 [Candidatus Bathyarchaeota archaeon]|nr:hypothetical protein [Candidatus Termitimicrobium sp.]
MSFKQRFTDAYQAFVKGKNRRALVYTTEASEGEMFEDPFMNWFLIDEKVNRCVCINAGFSTITSGFDTEIEVTAKPPEGATKQQQTTFIREVKAKYQPLLDFVNNINAKVNLDTTLFYNVIRTLIHGKMAWLILFNEKSVNKEPRRLVALPIKVGKDTGLQPVLDDEREVVRYEIPDEKNKDGTPKTYSLEEILYFCYMDLTGDKQGLSSLYPVLQACSLRREIRTRHYSRILERLWKIPMVAQVDTEGFEETPAGEAKERALLNQVTAAVDSGRNFAVNKNIELKTASVTLNMQSVLDIERGKSEEIIAQFGTAPFLVNQLSANFATAQVEYDSFISGTVADLQRFLKRELEAGWYKRLFDAYYNDPVVSAEKVLAEQEVRIKHVWRPAKKMSNVKEMVEIASLLYERGLGLCGEHPELAAEIAGLAELEAKLQNANTNVT